jgi:hypothetical protein
MKMFIPSDNLQDWVSEVVKGKGGREGDMTDPLSGSGTLRKLGA